MKTLFTQFLLVCCGLAGYAQPSADSLDLANTTSSTRKLTHCLFYSFLL